MDLDPLDEELIYAHGKHWGYSLPPPRQQTCREAGPPAMVARCVSAFLESVRVLCTGLLTYISACVCGTNSSDYEDVLPSSSSFWLEGQRKSIRGWNMVWVAFFCLALFGLNLSGLVFSSLDFSRSPTNIHHPIFASLGVAPCLILLIAEINAHLSPSRMNHLWLRIFLSLFGVFRNNTYYHGYLWPGAAIMGVSSYLFAFTAYVLKGLVTLLHKNVENNSPRSLYPDGRQRLLA
ncbi:hypothetical protein PROFUN_06001 [Planoprotostelium fungivorum]|uniref:Uncharacterized protein n=1 Tax=Planoprotostelium fungivorum TaxID=1890364 RepID=A0A2P6NPD2_9EUKA|nr:hypothetical protein PROFUN_06001 [Planoprotostelium fungivorum]